MPGDIFIFMAVLKKLFKPSFLLLKKIKVKRNTDNLYDSNLSFTKNDAILEKSTIQSTCAFRNFIDMWKCIFFKYLRVAKNLHRRYVKVETGN